MLYTQKRTVARAGHQRPLAFALICATGGAAIRISNQESVISR